MSFVIKLSIRYAANSILPHDHLAKKSSGDLIYACHKWKSQGRQLKMTPYDTDCPRSLTYVFATHIGHTSMLYNEAQIAMSVAATN